MGTFIQLVIDGLSAGSIYAALALAIVLVNQATGLINFAQGGMAVLATYVAWVLTNQGVPLDLPKAATAGAVQSVFTVSIDDQGSVRVNGHAVAGRASLGAEARRALAADPQMRTLISASQQASHGTVMQVVDSMRAVGVSKIAFAVDKSLPPATFEAQNDRE